MPDDDKRSLYAHRYSTLDKVGGENVDLGRWLGQVLVLI